MMPCLNEHVQLSLHPNSVCGGDCAQVSKFMRVANPNVIPAGGVDYANATASRFFRHCFPSSLFTIVHSPSQNEVDSHNSILLSPSFETRPRETAGETGMKAGRKERRRHSADEQRYHSCLSAQRASSRSVEIETEAREDVSNDCPDRMIEPYLTARHIVVVGERAVSSFSDLQ